MKKIYLFLMSALLFACSDVNQELDITISEKIASKATEQQVPNIKPWCFWLTGYANEPFFIFLKGDVVIEEDTGDNIVSLGNFEDYVAEYQYEFPVWGEVDFNKFVETPWMFKIKNFKMRFETITPLQDYPYGMRVTWFSHGGEKLFSFDVPRDKLGKSDVWDWVDMPDLNIPIPTYPDVTDLEFELSLEPSFRCEPLPKPY